MEVGDFCAKSKDPTDWGAGERARDIETSQGDEPGETSTAETKGRSRLRAERKEM